MSETELFSRLQSHVLESKRREQEAMERLKRLYEEHMKKPLEEQLKMAREALEYGYH
jgi:hypothetical protein